MSSKKIALVSLVIIVVVGGVLGYKKYHDYNMNKARYDGTNAKAYENQLAKLYASDCKELTTYDDQGISFEYPRCRGEVYVSELSGNIFGYFSNLEVRPPITFSIDAPKKLNKDIDELREGKMCSSEQPQPTNDYCVSIPNNTQILKVFPDSSYSVDGKYEYPSMVADLKVFKSFKTTDAISTIRADIADLFYYESMKSYAWGKTKEFPIQANMYVVGSVDANKRDVYVGLKRFIDTFTVK